MREREKEADDKPGRMSISSAREEQEREQLVFDSRAGVRGTLCVGGDRRG